jgi:hypothetical protein
MAHPGFDQTSARPLSSEPLEYPRGPREARPPPAQIRLPPAARVALAHGVYLLATGLMPIVAMRTFKKITGPKPEGWLAKGVGACMANIGGALTCAGARGKVAREVRILGISTALSFGAMDIWYGGIRRRISPVYLVNGAAQLGFAAAWLYAEWRENLDVRRAPEPAFA